MLDGLIRAHRAGDQRGALLRAYHLAFLALAVPGVPLGLLYRLSGPAAHGLGAAAVLIGAAALLAGVVLGRVRRMTRPGPVPLPVAKRLTAALQLGSAPGVPFLLGCSAFHDGPTWLGCWAAALVAYLLGRRQVLELSRA